MLINAFTKILTISVVAVGLTACTPTNFKPAHNTSAYECKRLQNRSLITLEQERACRMGQPYNLKSDNSSPIDSK